MLSTNKCACCEENFYELTFDSDSVDFNGENFTVTLNQDEAEALRTELREVCLFNRITGDVEQLQAALS